MDGGRKSGSGMDVLIYGISMKYRTKHYHAESSQRLAMSVISFNAFPIFCVIRFSLSQNKRAVFCRTRFSAYKLLLLLYVTVRGRTLLDSHLYTPRNCALTFRKNARRGLGRLFTITRQKAFVVATVEALRD